MRTSEEVQEYLMNSLEWHVADLEIEVAELMISNDMLKRVIINLLEQDEEYCSVF